MKSAQKYISNELTHFVGYKCKQFLDKQYIILKKILNDEELRPTAEITNQIRGYTFDSSKKISDNEMFTPFSVSFSDIPISDLNIHVRKYGRCGLSFKKDFIAKQGGKPMHYIPKYGSYNEDESNAEYFDRLIPQYRNLFTLVWSNGELRQRINNFHEIDRFLSYTFLGYLKFFDHNLKDNDEENFYFEREWRAMGRVKFSIEDVKRIFIPKKYAVRLREDFPRFHGELTFT